VRGVLDRRGLTVTKVQVYADDRAVRVTALARKAHVSALQLDVNAATGGWFGGVTVTVRETELVDS